MRSISLVPELSAAEQAHSTCQCLVTNCPLSFRPFEKCGGTWYLTCCSFFLFFFVFHAKSGTTKNHRKSRVIYHIEAFSIMIRRKLIICEKISQCREKQVQHFLIVGLILS